MKSLVLNWSASGLGEAVKRTVISLVKTMIAAGLVYLLNQLSVVSVNPTSHYGELLIALVGGGHAVLTFLQHWLGTADTTSPVVS